MPIYSKYSQKVRFISERPANRNLLLCFILCTVLTVSLTAHEDVQNQIAELSRQIVKTPQNAELHLRRGELHRIRRNWDAALADYKAAEKLDPELTVVTLCRGKLHLD